MMKILFITVPCFADNSFSLIHAFQQEGHDVTCLLDLNSLNSTIINFNNRPQRNGIMLASQFLELERFRAYLDFDKFYVANYHISRRISPFALLRITQFYKFLKKFDLIHIDHKLEGVDQLLYMPYGSKMVLTKHDPIPHSGMEMNNSNKRMWSKAYKYVPKIVIHNKEQKEEFCRINDIDAKRVLVNNMCLYDCLDVYKNYDVKKDENTILFFGRIVKYKGLEYLCEAMKIIHQRLPDLKLLIAGKGNLYFDFDRYKDLKYIELQNRFIETLELVQMIQKCSLVICPYVDATQSGVVMTCNAFDVPVVVTNVGGLPAMVEDGKSGIVVPAKDPVALAEAVMTLFSDSRKLEEMRGYIRNMYSSGPRSPKEIVDKYIDFYERKV